ncbi:submaxillary gland androgen-regulated protein 3A-like [Peromyscus eremicus]|uniref:submaxillary gland androgen-regulated protein 3A-like n=1 Tax=Peromyscus eremicus TaxID=42410 RepID=UPI0027DD722A|nr:submaxillary gland androgen-regulated protein 3A-like [Peromyscus eremicus]
MKPLYLVLGLWILGGCFLSGECHRGPGGRHDPRGPPPPPPRPFGPGFGRPPPPPPFGPGFGGPPPPPFGPGFGGPPPPPFGPGFGRPPPPPFGPGFGRPPPPPPFGPYPPAQPRPPTNPPLTPPPPPIQANITPSANISLTTAAASNATDDFLSWWQRLISAWQQG